MIKNFDFHADDRTIGDILFSNKYKYSIPRYQRPYSWELDQIDELWNDLKGSDDTFFIGSFVFNLEHLEEKGFIEVIDGQQRLMTITILMAAMREVAREEGMEGIAHRIQTNCIAFENRRGHQTYRITPGESIRSYFVETIQKSDKGEVCSPKTKEQKLVFKNFEELKFRVRNELKGVSDAQTKEDILDALWEKVDELKVIWIEIKSEEDAYVIFETVNARGAELQVSDLLKNLIFKNVKVEDGADIAKQKWQSIEDKFDQSFDVSKFIRHFWLSKYGYAGEKQLYKEIKRRISGSEFRNFLDELEQNASIYNMLMTGSLEEWSAYKNGAQIFSVVKGFRAMNVNQVNMLLLCLVRNLDKVNVNPQSFLKKIENFTFQYSAVSKLPTNRIEKLYSKSAIELEKIALSNLNGKDSQYQTKLMDLIHGFKAEAPSQAIFMDKFAEIGYKDSPKGRGLICYILAKINQSMGTGETAVDFSNANIEHFLPQSPSSEWKLNKEEIKDYVNLLGNLTLMHKKINSKASNKSIKEKIDALRESEVALTVEMAREIEQNDFMWGRNEILERQNKLANLAYNKVWPL